MNRSYVGDLRRLPFNSPVRICGWVQYVRDFGRVVFVVVKDRTGIVQTYVSQDDTALLAEAKRLSPDDVICVDGILRERPEDMKKPDVENGDIEIEAKQINVLNRCSPLPYDVNGDPSDITRLKYRYIDIRHSGVLRNLQIRSRASMAIRNYLATHGFVEVETPYLTKYTPGGARNFVVPVRQQPGKFYALAESPQIFKQILMISGLDKYFQFARCFRDEDLRADRQPEFTQVDLEASFIDEEYIYGLIEGLMKQLFMEVLGVEIVTPFPRLTYDEAMNLYGTDKPDLRFELPIIDFSENFESSRFNAFKSVVDSGGFVKGLYWSEPLDRGALKALEQASTGSGQKFLFISKAEESFLTNGPKSVLVEESWLQRGTYVLVAGDSERALQFLGELRLALAKHIGLIPEGRYAFVWVTERPMFEVGEDGNLQAAHHPFTMPNVTSPAEVLENPLKLRARAYDIVLNGVEVGGGSIRIHRPEIQEAVFRVLGLSDEEIEERFGFFLNALSLGAPPHGGIALGFDRLAMILAGAESLREVIAFPKTKSGLCPLTGAPSELFRNQKEELLPVFKAAMEGGE